MPQIAPQLTQTVKDSTIYPGWYFVEHEVYDRLPFLDLYIVFALYGIEIEERLTKNEQKRRNHIEWYGTAQQKVALQKEIEDKKAEKANKGSAALALYASQGAAAAASSSK